MTSNSAVPAPATAPSSDRLAVLALLGSSTMWGLLWWPLKGFAAAGLSGITLSLLTYGVLGLCGIGFLWRERPAWRSQTLALVMLTLAGGWANSAFVQALMIGDVVRVMLLFYLSPVWAVLGGRIFLGEKVSPRRAAAVALALLGLWFVVGGADVLSKPLSHADWLALSAGLCFAANNVISRASQAIPMLSKTVSMFVGCGLVAACMFFTGGHELPSPSGLMVLALFAYAFGWVVLATATWQYGVTHLEAGRAGLLLTVELLVALVSAMLIGGESMLPREWLGGSLIAAAALLEATDTTPTTKEKRT